MLRSSSISHRSHAIVIGGGIAGLLAARGLVNHFERITIVERDQYPRNPEHRPGTPQDRQVHTMLLRGQHILEALFPGLGKKLVAQGAIERDYGPESLYYYGGRSPSSQLPAGVLRGWNCSRLLLEWQIRQELKHYQIDILEGHEVIHLIGNMRSVSGVQFRVRHHNPSETHDLEADLVIDATGASSRVPQWLEELGYKAPKEIVVNPGLGYATRLYEIPAHFPLNLKSIAVQGTQPPRRGGSLMEIEEKRWMVVLAGSCEDYPPTDEQGYLNFARSLPDRAIYDAIKDAKPISTIYGYRRTENRQRLFERLPAGFIVMGDAACAFNPIYGQGITVAALEALTLDTCLRKGQLARFQSKVARVVALPWQLATASDARSSQEEGAKARGFSRWLRQYVEGVIALLPSDPMVLLTFLQVIHMLRSPSALMRPSILVKVFVHQYVSARRNRD